MTDSPIIPPASPGIVQSRARAADGAGPEGRMAAIDALLRLRRRNLTLPPDIMELYRQSTRASTRRMMASWSICVTVVNLATGLLDFPTRADLIGEVTCRSFISLVFLLAAALLQAGRLRDQEHYVLIVPCVLMIAATGWFHAAAGDSSTFEQRLIMSIVAVYTGILFVQIQMRYMVILAIMSVIMMTALLVIFGPADRHDNAQIIAFYTITMAAVLAAKQVQDRYRHRLFLLRARDDFQAQQASRRNEQLTSIAYTDRLTDLPNRRYFEEIIDTIDVHPEAALPLSLCMIDIDNFKILNDELGHLRGDRCLRLVAGAIRRNLRGKSDILARFGGEEFVLVLPNTSGAEAWDVAERIRAAVLEINHANPGTALGRVSVSIGIATAGALPFDTTALIDAADQALYHAKESGRNQVAA